MARAYAELGADRLDHLANTVDRYLEVPHYLWWLEPASQGPRVGFGAAPEEPLGCLWLGQSINQMTGAPQVYVYLIYVAPAHRRRGLGRRLMQQAQVWASSQGYSQIGLQVFNHNQPALKLYRALGYRSQASWMTLDL